jgi:hypothetical protein
MTCVHCLTPEMFVQARHVLHVFCCYLARLNGNREGLDWVRKRLVESNLLPEPVTELHAISELVDEDESLTEGNEEFDRDNSYGI